MVVHQPNCLSEAVIHNYMMKSIITCDMQFVETCGKLDSMSVSHVLDLS